MEKEKYLRWKCFSLMFEQKLKKEMFKVSGRDTFKEVIN